jgi:hypothetical protein
MKKNIDNPRIAREKETVQAMIGIYCSGHHGTDKDLCTDCTELLSYSFSRLDKCPYQSSKPTCTKCTIHCYKPEMRARIREVMRFSGPRILIKHPALLIKHFFDKFRKTKKGKIR